jgi:Sulfotransferase family
MILSPDLPRRIRNKYMLLRSYFSRVATPQASRLGRYKYVFIITYGRTGSTLLQKILCHIPGYYIAGENMNALYGIYESYRNSRVLKSEFGYFHVPSDHPWHGAHAVNPEDFARQMAEAFVTNVISPPRNAKVIGFKEIRYMLVLDSLGGYLRFMADVFPESIFIFNTRAATSVGKSGWWKDKDQADLAADIARLESIVESVMTDHAAQFVRISYEEWSKNPDALKPVFAKLGAEFDPNAIQAILDVPLKHLK